MYMSDSVPVHRGGDSGPYAYYGYGHRQAIGLDDAIVPRRLWERFEAAEAEYHAAMSELDCSIDANRIEPPPPPQRLKRQLITQIDVAGEPIKIRVDMAGEMERVRRMADEMAAVMQRLAEGGDDATT